MVTLFGSTLTLRRHRGDPASCSTSQLALLTFIVFPILGARLARLPDRLGRRVPAHAREGRARSPPTCRRRCRASASCARSRRSARHLERFAELNEDNREANMKTVNLNAAYFPGVELLSALATAGILLYGGFQAIHGDVTIGVLVAFIAALNNFFDPIQQLSQLYTTYQAGMAALDKIFELLDEEPDLRDAPDAIELDRVRGEIVFERRDVHATGPARRARATSTCTSRRARPSRWSARPAPASRRSPSSSRASTTRPRAACWSTATTCATSPRTRCARRWASCRRRRSCSAARSARTSRFGRPDATLDGDRGRRPRRRRRRVHRRARRRATTRRSASAASSSRPASASSSPSPAR